MNAGWFLDCRGYVVLDGDGVPNKALKRERENGFPNWALRERAVVEIFSRMRGKLLFYS